MMLKITKPDNSYDMFELLNYSKFEGNHFYVMVKETEGYNDWEYVDGENFQTHEKYSKVEIFTDQMVLIDSI